MVFFNMIPSMTAPAPKPKHRSRTLKRKPAAHAKQTAKLHRGKKIKHVRGDHKSQMRGGFAGEAAGGCETTGLVTEPGLNIPSLMKGVESGLNISKTLAKIERGQK
jgi:hypothetical protein